MNLQKKEDYKKYLIYRHSSPSSEFNVNTNNNAIDYPNKHSNGSFKAKNLDKKKAKHEKKILDSHDLVQKSLSEVASLYRASAFIEICIFILLELILATYYLYEINVPQLYQINSVVKTERLKFNDKVLENLQNIDYDNRIKQIIYETLDLGNFKEQNGSLDKSILFYYHNTIKKVDPKFCEKTTFDLYFKNVYENIDCFPFFSHEKRLIVADNHEEDSKLFDPVQIASRVISKNLRAFEMEFFIIDSYLTVFNLSIEINPTGKVKVKDDIFSFNIRDKIRMRRSYLFVVFVFFMVYYGYETVQDILSGEFLSTQRLVMEGLDLLNFYFLFMSIYYLYMFTFLHKSDIYPLLKGFENNQGSHTRQIIVNCVDSYKKFSSFFSCFYIISFGRLFKYSIIFRPFEIIVKSIKTICFNIHQFFLFYFVIFIGFALFGMSMFGQTLESYSTLQRSCLTLVGIVFGELNFQYYYNHNSSVGTIYFCLYVITVVIILFNILCVVITESYRSMKFYMKSESQRLNIVPDCYFIRRNFNLLVRIKLKYYQPEMREILEGMVLMKTANRLLTKVEIDHDLKTLEYTPNVLNAVLNKYGYKRKDMEWKKNQMDSFRSKIEKERRHLNDLFLIHMKINQQFFEKKYKMESSKNLFISKERYLNLDRKILKLKRLLDVLKKKANFISKHVNESIQTKL